MSQNLNISSLPPEILKMVIECMDTPTLLHAREVSTLWRTFSTIECRKREISLKTLDSLQDLLVFNRVFRNQNSAFPWSSYHSHSEEWVGLDFDYLFIREFGIHLKNMVLYVEDDPGERSIVDFLRCIPNVRWIEFEGLFDFGEKWFREGDLDNFDLIMPMLEKISIGIPSIGFPMFSSSYMFLNVLCKQVNYVDVMLSNLYDGVVAQTLATILFQVPNVSLHTFMCNAIPCQVLVDAQVKINCLKIGMSGVTLEIQEGYERLIFSASNTLQRIQFSIYDKVKDIKPFKFPILHHVVWITFKFYNNWWCKNLDNGQMESYVSDITPTKVPLLKTLKLYCCPEDAEDEETGIPQNLKLFKVQDLFRSVLWMYVNGFDTGELKNNFPNAVFSE